MCSAPKRKLGLWMLTALVAGNMIGSGVFLLPASLAGIGSISLLSWLFTLTGAFMLGMTFVYLSRMLPKTGGPYVYAQAGFGQFIGFQTAYSYWMAAWIGNAAIAVAMVGYLQVVFPVLGENLNLRVGIAIGLVWLLVLVNLAGIREAGYVQVITTVLKIIPLGLVAFFGWFFVHPEYYFEHVNVTHDPVLSDISAVSLAAALTMWAFIGLESATVPADSTENPRRNIPLATILGISIAAVLYIAGSMSIIGVIPNAELQVSTSPYADAAAIILGVFDTGTATIFSDFGRWLVAIGAVISCFGCLNGWTLVQVQVPMAAADAGLFPKFFAKRNARGVPVYGLIVTSILISGLLLLTSNQQLVKQFEIIILLAVLSSLVPYLYTTMSLLILRKKFQQQSRLQVVVAILASIYILWAIFSTGEELLFYGCTIFFSSIPLYGIFLAKRAAATQETVSL